MYIYKLKEEIYELSEKPKDKVTFETNQINENVTAEEIQTRNKSFFREKSLLVVILNSLYAAFMRLLLIH